MGGPFGGPRGVGRLSRRAGRNLEALLEVREGWGGVGSPIGMAGWFGSPPKRARRRRESHTGTKRGREALPESWEGSGDTPERGGRSLEALPEGGDGS